MACWKSNLFGTFIKKKKNFIQREKEPKYVIGCFGKELLQSDQLKSVLSESDAWLVHGEYHLVEQNVWS